MPLKCKKCGGCHTAQTPCRQPPEYHTTVAEALEDGWIMAYVGTQNGPGEPRIYGQKPGNHRVWRCYKFK